jgi:hypothetical protein
MKKYLAIAAAVALAGLTRAEITPMDGDNDVGFLSLTVPTGSCSVVVSVPFEKCLGSGEAGMLADLVSTNLLVGSNSDPAEADQIVALTTNAAGELLYYYYWLKNGAGWTTSVTTRINADPTNVVPPAADAFPVARGLGFWLKRPAGSAVAGVYLKGQVSTVSSPLTLKPGLTLIGLGVFTTTSINSSSIGWGTRNPGSGLTGMDKLYLINNGTDLAEYKYDGTSQKWVDNDWGATEAGVAAGEGFWYLRRGSQDLTFTPVTP